MDAGVVADVIDAQDEITASLTAGGTSAGLFSVVIGSVGDNVSRAPTEGVDPGARCAAPVQAGNLAVQYAPVPCTRRRARTGTSRA